MAAPTNADINAGKYFGLFGNMFEQVSYDVTPTASKN